MQNPNNYFLQWQSERIAVLRHGWVPDQFWVHFELEVLENTKGVTAQMLASRDWWNAHFLEVQYRDDSEGFVMSGEFVIPSPQSKTELALRGIGFDGSHLNTVTRRSWFSKLLKR